VIRPFEPAIHHRLTILRPASGTRTPIVLDFIDAFTDSLTPFRAEDRA
jgi:hypothetical protein